MSRPARRPPERSAESTGGIAVWVAFAVATWTGVAVVSPVSSRVSQLIVSLGALGS